MLRNQKFSNNFIVTGVICIVIGIILLSSNYINGKVDKAYNSMNLSLLALNNTDKDEPKEEEIKEEVKEEKKVEVKKTTPVVVKDPIKYIGKLSIPKISLERGFVKIGSKYNDLSYGIQTLKESTYPDQEKNNLILTSHSGTSYRSFFKNLYKLVIGDKAYIEYNNKTYTYAITKIYNKPKGMVTIDRDYDKSTLTLITCTKNSQTEQTIYILELI